MQQGEDLDWYTNQHPWVAPETIVGNTKNPKQVMFVVWGT